MNESLRTGGAGGQTSIRPPGITAANWDSRPGNPGGNGRPNFFVENQEGGRSGRITIGSTYIGGEPSPRIHSRNNFHGYQIANIVTIDNRPSALNYGSGGAGGYSSNNPGVAGGGGEVIINVAWLEL